MACSTNEYGYIGLQLKIMIFMHLLQLFLILRPSSRGHVSIVDKDSRTYAKIKQNYLSTDQDRMVAAKDLN